MFCSKRRTCRDPPSWVSVDTPVPGAVGYTGALLTPTLGPTRRLEEELGLPHSGRGERVHGKWVFFF